MRILPPSFLLSLFLMPTFGLSIFLGETNVSLAALTSEVAECANGYTNSTADTDVKYCQADNKFAVVLTANQTCTADGTCIFVFPLDLNEQGFDFQSTWAFLAYGVFGVLLLMNLSMAYTLCTKRGKPERRKKRKTNKKSHKYEGKSVRMPGDDELRKVKKPGRETLLRLEDTTSLLGAGKGTFVSHEAAFQSQKVDIEREIASPSHSSKRVGRSRKRRSLSWGGPADSRMRAGELVDVRIKNVKNPWQFNKGLYPSSIKSSVLGSHDAVFGQNSYVGDAGDLSDDDPFFQHAVVDAHDPFFDNFSPPPPPRAGVLAPGMRASSSAESRSKRRGSFPQHSSLRSTRSQDRRESLRYPQKHLPSPHPGSPGAQKGHMFPGGGPSHARRNSGQAALDRLNVSLRVLPSLVDPNEERKDQGFSPHNRPQSIGGEPSEVVLDSPNPQSRKRPKLEGEASVQVETVSPSPGSPGHQNNLHPEQGNRGRTLSRPSRKSQNSGLQRPSPPPYQTPSYRMNPNGSDLSALVDPGSPGREPGGPGSQPPDSRATEEAGLPERQVQPGSRAHSEQLPKAPKPPGLISKAQSLFSPTKGKKKKIKIVPPRPSERIPGPGDPTQPVDRRSSRSIKLSVLRPRGENTTPIPSPGIEKPIGSWDAIELVKTTKRGPSASTPPATRSEDDEDNFKFDKSEPQPGSPEKTLSRPSSLLSDPPVGVEPALTELLLGESSKEVPGLPPKTDVHEGDFERTGVRLTAVTVCEDRGRMERPDAVSPISGLGKRNSAPLAGGAKIEKTQLRLVASETSEFVPNRHISLELLNPDSSKMSVKVVSQQEKFAL